MTLAPPGWFSTTICCPIAAARRSPTIRQMMSGVPPAASDTMMRTGLAGQVVDEVWAAAGWVGIAAVASANASETNDNATRSLMGFLLIFWLAVLAPGPDPRRAM